MNLVENKEEKAIDLLRNWAEEMCRLEPVLIENISSEVDDFSAIVISYKNKEKSDIFCRYVFYPTKLKLPNELIIDNPSWLSDIRFKLGDGIDFSFNLDRLSKKWFSLTNENRLVGKDLVPLSDDILKMTINEILPVKKFLSKDEIVLREVLNNKTVFSGQDMLDRSYLNRVYGIDEEDFQEDFAKPLEKQILICEKFGLNLPAAYIQFFSDIEYFNILRFRNERFFACEPIIQLGKKRSEFIIQFGTADYGGGGAWYYLFLNNRGEHCILYSNFDINEARFSPIWQGIHFADFFICSCSFEEFIKRLSLDFTEREREEN